MPKSATATLKHKPRAPRAFTCTNKGSNPDYYLVKSRHLSKIVANLSTVREKKGKKKKERERRKEKEEKARKRKKTKEKGEKERERK